ncbi:hypothetical protein Cni_G16300 [Canna indica]|uniref:Uncharacterized protein n=1 Tax=Canna indica TaxID=4628 RepID=A0AAQ3KKT4_9LILI|nr:hypothetical protein Cni_G16300 [Canna indica]
MQLEHALLPPLTAHIVFRLLKDNGFNKVKLFEADPEALRALGHTNIDVQLPNDYLSSFPATTPLPIADDPTSPTNLMEAPTSSATTSTPVVISLNLATLQRLEGNRASLMVSIYMGQTGSTYEFSSGRLLGRVPVAVVLETVPTRSTVV